MKQRVRNFICAYCRGKGRDPFGLLSPLAACQVCGGKGRVVIVATEERIIKCSYCQGSGRHRFTRMSCTVCMGRGMIVVDPRGAPCESCHGSGMAQGKALPCSVCSGRGVVEPARRQRVVSARGRKSG